MSEFITTANTTTFVRSLLGEPTTEYFSDAEIALYIKIGIMMVMGKYWYLLGETDKTVTPTSLVANTPYIAMPGASVGTAQATAVLDDATFGGTYTYKGDLTYRVEIDGTTPDTFKWSKDGGTTWEASLVAITTVAQALDNGVTVTIAASTGHTLTDLWDSDCDATDCSKIVKVEVASTGKQLRYINEDEIWKYDPYDDGGASSNYLNLWYLPVKTVVGDFPDAMRPLIAFEAASYGLLKDKSLDAGFLRMKKQAEDAAIIAMSVAQMQEPFVMGDSGELITTYTSTNPVAWSFRDGKIYLYKYNAGV